MAKTAAKPKKAPAKKASAAKTAPKAAAKKTPRKVSKAVKAPTSGLHYDKEALLKDYEETYQYALIGISAVVFIGLSYFFVMIVMLGSKWQTPHQPFVEQFGDRIQIEYDGLKLPVYNDDE